MLLQLERVKRTAAAQGVEIILDESLIEMLAAEGYRPEYGARDNDRVGNWTEPITAPAFNTHFKDALVEFNIKSVSCGHDHVNDYCSLSKDPESGEPEIWMCYAGGSGFGGYAGYNHYHRRLRVFEIDTNQARIVTWKRLEYGDLDKRLDQQIIVDSGRVMPIQVGNQE